MKWNQSKTIVVFFNSLPFLFFFFFFFGFSFFSRLVLKISIFLGRYFFLVFRVSFGFNGVPPKTFGLGQVCHNISIAVVFDPSDIDQQVKLLFLFLRVFLIIRQLILKFENFFFVSFGDMFGWEWDMVVQLDHFWFKFHFFENCFDSRKELMCVWSNYSAVNVLSSWNLDSVETFL